MVDRRRPPIVSWAIPLLIGFVGLYRVTHSPTFEMYRAVDIVQLLDSGVCFGAAMAAVIYRFRGRRSLTLKWTPDQDRRTRTRNVAASTFVQSGSFRVA